MEYYAIQVWTGKEDEFVERLGLQSLSVFSIFVPKRAVNIRRRGKIKREEKPIFPGYVFIGVDSDTLGIEDRWVIRSTNYFMRTLPDTKTPQPVKEQDRRILSHFMSFGKVADVSRVTFDDNDRILVADGPLKGLEGHIVRVDKRDRKSVV